MIFKRPKKGDNGSVDYNGIGISFGSTLKAIGQSTTPDSNGITCSTLKINLSEYILSLLDERLKNIEDKLGITWSGDSFSDIVK